MKYNQTTLKVHVLSQIKHMTSTLQRPIS